MAKKYNPRILADGSEFEKVRWKAVRARAIAIYEHRCALCGQELDAKAPPHTRFSIEVDHRLPVGRGNPNPYELEGLRLLCHPCNRRKGSKLDSELNRKPEETALPISNRW